MAVRKTRCTPKMAQAIADHIAMGMSTSDAAALAGIHRDTFYRWMKRGARAFKRMQKAPGQEVQAQEAPFLAFYRLVQQAIPRRKQALLAQIQQAAREPQHWQAAAWLLERLHPEEFGRRDRLTLEWRREAERLGIDADAAYQQLVEKFAAMGD